MSLANSIQHVSSNIYQKKLGENFGDYAKHFSYHGTYAALAAHGTAYISNLYYG